MVSSSLLFYIIVYNIYIYTYKIIRWWLEQLKWLRLNGMNKDDSRRFLEGMESPLLMHGTHELWTSHHHKNQPKEGQNGRFDFNLMRCNWINIKGNEMIEIIKAFKGKSRLVQAYSMGY